MGEKRTFGEILKGEDGGCTPVRDWIDAKLPINTIPKNAGLFNTPVCRTPFSYVKPAGAWMQENQGAYITMGQIPPSGLASGYGAKGIPAESIDLVVGRNSSANSGKGPKKGSAIDNNFATDAARIYISRLCNIDQIFGLDSRPGALQGRGLVARSGIGIKADGVRIVGREGVKITTGKMAGAKFGLFGETNSLGGKISMPAPKIELVAGNNFKDVQGVALGNRTRDSLRELHALVGELWGAVFNLALAQAGVHIVSSANPTEAPPVGWPPIPAIHSWAGNKTLSAVLSPLYQMRINSEMWKFNYLQASGPDYIVSRNVKTN